jgi:hypothetical protein
VQRGLLAEFNASTPANRSSAAAGNNVIRNLLTLQGYVSDGLLKLINASMGGNRDRTVIAGILAKTPMLLGLALMSILIGLMVGTVVGAWEKWVRGRQASLPTPLDRDFWSSFGNFFEGTARLSLAQLFYLGDAALAIRGEIQGNRGFDPMGRVFPISIAQRGMNAVRGMWTLPPGDKLTPMADLGRSLLPWWMESERVFRSTQKSIDQGKRVILGTAQLNDLLPERRAQAFTGPSYGPTSVIRRKLSDAVSGFWEKQQAGDAAGAAQSLENAKAELKRLEDFYAAKYQKAGSTPEQAAYKAHQDAWRDYQEINPVVAGMLGKRPTRAEYDLLRSKISGDRLRAVDNAVAAWQAGGQALFGRATPVTREDVAAARTGGGGRGGFAGIPSQLPRVAAIGAVGGLGRRRAFGLRPAGLRRARRGAGAPRLRVSRPAAGGGRGLGRRGGLRLRRLGLRRQRATTPRVTRLRRISGRSRRLGLGRPRRRRQSAAL